MAPPLLVRAVRRAAHILGYELKPRLPGGEVCLARLKEIRSRIAEVDPVSRAFLQFCLEHLSLSNADMLQDLFVLHETGRKRDGYFVEFGAADGVSGSNSYALETRFGWRGILAEPARCWHDALMANRTCVVDRRCVTDASGETVTFRECSYPANATIDAYADSYRFAPARRRFVRYDVPTVSLTDMLRQHGSPSEPDYLSMDTEGSELMILRGLDFAAFRPRLITVEHCHSPTREPLFELLTAKGYRRKHEQLSGIEDWYVAG